MEQFTLYSVHSLTSTQFRRAILVLSSYSRLSKRNLIHASIPYLALVSCEPARTCVAQLQCLLCPAALRKFCEPDSHRHLLYETHAIPDTTDISIPWCVYPLLWLLSLCSCGRPTRSILQFLQYSAALPPALHTRYVPRHLRKAHTKSPPQSSAPTQNRTPSCRSIMAC
ncbi:hypothetical protein GGI35DRAFT_327591 [Trichoderma velutinum]